MKKTEVLTGIKSFDKATLEDEKPGVALILENGDELEKDIEEMQNQINDFRLALDRISLFDPEFSVVGSKTTERLDGQKFNVHIQSGDHGKGCRSARLSDIEGYLSRLQPDEVMTIKLAKE